MLHPKARKPNSAGLAIKVANIPHPHYSGLPWRLGPTPLGVAGPYLGRDGSRMILKEEALETVDPQPFLFLVLGLGVR